MFHFIFIRTECYLPFYSPIVQPFKFGISQSVFAPNASLLAFSYSTILLFFSSSKDLHQITLLQSLGTKKALRGRLCSAICSRLRFPRGQDDCVCFIRTSAFITQDLQLKETRHLLFLTHIPIEGFLVNS